MPFWLKGTPLPNCSGRGTPQLNRKVASQQVSHSCSPQRKGAKLKEVVMTVDVLIFLLAVVTVL